MPFTSLGPSLIWDAMSLCIPQLEHAFLGMVPYPSLSCAELSSHSIGRVIVVWLAFIHPITIALVSAENWLSGAVVAACFALLPYAVHGTLFYIFSQVSHVQRECFPETKVRVY